MKDSHTKSLSLVLFCGIILTIVLTSPQSSYAQASEGPQISYWGIFQPRLSYGSNEDTSTNRFGYGIRRARFRVELQLKNKIGVRYDVDVASGSLQSVDLFAFYRASPKVQVRFGIMPSAQPRAHIFTPLPVIDGFDRAVIAEQWAAATLGGGGRDFGLDIQYQTDSWTLVGFLHNGDGSFSRSRGNFSQTISSQNATGDVDRTVMATSAYAAYRFPSLPDLEIGGYLSYNPAKNPNTDGREYTSYATHIYYGAIPGSLPFRLKFDLIGINFQGDNEQESLGVSVLGAVRLTDYSEFFARYENVQPDTDLENNDFISAGITFSVSKLMGGNYSDQRFTLGYSLLDTPGETSQHLVVLQLQLML